MFDFYMDAHMHFDLYDNRNEVLRYVQQKESYTIAVTNLPQLFEKYKHQYMGNKYFQLALGFHPELVYQYSNQQMLFKELINETRFIGEIGLDYTKKSKEDVMCQTEIFEKIIKWCSGKNKILSVHSRSASKKVVDILNGFDGTVILHWYSGGITDLRRAIEQGCYFSINHQMLQSVNGRNIVGNIPVDRILLESDAPFTKGLSEKYYVNSAYLGQLFRKKYGQSFKDYLNNYRIEQASNQLIHTDKKIIQIAEEVGYHDLDYFVNRFIQVKGCTPARFRKQMFEE